MPERLAVTIPEIFELMVTEACEQHADPAAEFSDTGLGVTVMAPDPVVLPGVYVTVNVALFLLPSVTSTVPVAPLAGGVAPGLNSTINAREDGILLSVCE